MQLRLAESNVFVCLIQGLARCFIHLIGPLETWAAKLNLATSGNSLADSEWRRLDK